ncbi:restriction endonuclease subunit S [Pseudomonas sediminis]|uniref:restriction endonuclease subunit S n=1 Tax=Pseudomonas sediminis TaxID=1691904 RepID=UPI00244984B9|nr:restriction endonuclease subunit S [Pseudomonas sediminis]MDG9759211.1 restriction endonuclease subunit S [Pseudomonas sediminis]
MQSHEQKFKSLADIGSISRGKSKHRPRNDPSLYGGAYPFIQTGDVKAAHFYLSSFSQTYNERGLSQSKLWQPGTLCITIAANIADTAILKIPACFPDSIIGFLPNKDVADVRFVKYCLDTYKQQMQSISQGTTQDNLSQEKLLSIKFKIPQFQDQQRIAAILSACDDLIENNRRRVELLQNMAEELYREWFVRFRFPGWQQAKFEKGIPVGWDVAEAKNYFSYVKGKSYKGDELSEKESDMPFVTLKSFNRGGGYREEGLKRYSGRFRPEQVVNDGDIVMAVTDMTQEREVVGRVARISNIGARGAVISLDVIKLTPKEMSKSYLYSYMRLSGFGRYIKEFANGTNVLHLNPEIVMRQKIIVPPERLREKFCAVVDPIHAEIDALTNICRKLLAQRDMLLPRLISGKLPVDQLDIQFPPSMREAEAARLDVAHA